ncbi:MAG: hypothetical protein RIQ53_3534 [Pseudomonadota bacterium]
MNDDGSTRVGARTTTVHLTARRPAAPGGLAARLTQWLRQALARLRGRPRGSDELTTQLPPTRGHALRDAHRLLRRRLRQHPALRTMLPHLAVIERKLARRGSRALRDLPLPVLQRGLQQLAMLQREDEPPLETLQLRVLRLRLIEAIETRQRHGEPLVLPPRPHLHLAGDPSSAWDDGSADDEHASSDLDTAAFEDPDARRPRAPAHPSHAAMAGGDPAERPIGRLRA